MLTACPPSFLSIEAVKTYTLKSIIPPIFTGNLDIISSFPRKLIQGLFVKTSLIKPNVHWRECICRLTNPSLEALPYYLVRSITCEFMAQDSKATCTATYIMELPPSPSQSEECKPSLFGKPQSS